LQADADTDACSNTYAGPPYADSNTYGWRLHAICKS
jgi:hypothetical protein